MNTRLRLIYLLLLLFGLNLHAVMAQADFASEQEFKKQAEKLFDAEEFEKAYPLYSQLVSLYRKDPNYNFRLGVCMLYASDEKERAITFLEFATRNQDVEKEAFFYLAKAYHLHYRFDDAIAQYQVYKKITSGAKAERLQVDRQIEMCKNGKKLLRNLTDLPVIEKTELSREDFFRSYDISEIGGKLLMKPDEKEFRTSLDKKKNEKSILYLASNGSQIYFSSYGDNEQHGKDIFLMKKLPSGEWGKPQLLGNTVNTAYDEDYPFLHPNGKVLYFCSKGHNSMGGYDIFKTTLNEETNSWNEPVNMDFPINTPDDDILYITNSDERKAYFASARSSVAGKISVYHIHVERKPIDFAIIKGTVVKNRNDRTLNIKITVKNVNDNTILGIYNSKAETSTFDIKLPNGGRFLYTVESDGYATQSEIVEIPVQTEFKPLKQEISYELPGNKLIIRNSFNEAPDDSNYLLALNVIKEKSKLEVTPVTELSVSNTTKEESLPTTTDTAIVQQANTTKTNTKLSNDDIVNIAYQDANVVDTEATNAREQADIALNFANQKNEQAQSKSQEAAALLSAASTTEDNVKKQTLTDEANAATKEAEQLNEETVVAYNLAKKLDVTAVAKREEADLSQQYAKELEAAVKSNKSKDALAKLDQLEKKLDTLSQANAANSTALNSFKKEEENKKRELDKVIQESGDLKQEMIDNETIIANLKTDADNAKSAKLKEGLNNQMEELKQENRNKQKELEQNEIKTARLQKEYSGIKNETELVSTVIDQSKTGSSETAAAKVASIDKNKLEQQVNSIATKSELSKNSKQETGNIASSPDTTSSIVTKVPSVTDTTISPSTTTIIANEFPDRDKQFSDDLATAEKIENENDREKEKAAILIKWSKAIDADVAKQKQDYIATTDTKKKALIDKKINDAEKSSKEKQAEAYQSLAKVETLKQENAATTTDDTAPMDTTTITTSEFGRPNDSENTKKQFSYTDTAANAKITKANILTEEANDLLAKSLVYQFETVDKTSNITKKEQKKQGDDLVKRSKAKRAQAYQLYEVANKTEYTSNQKEIEQLAKITSTNTSPEVLKAEILSDEAENYFKKAKEQRETANSMPERYSETAFDAALKSEMMALEKQKESVDIYKKYNPNLATSSVKTNNTVKKSPVETTNKTSVEAGKPSNRLDHNKQFSYTDASAGMQISEASDLTDEANDLMAQSVAYYSEADNSTNNETKTERKKQGDELVKKAQANKVKAAELIAGANKVEYTSNQAQIDQLAKATFTNSPNKSNELFHAEIISDDAEHYFIKAQELRKMADSTPDYSAKEELLEDARSIELSALDKQNQSVDIYKKYSLTENIVAATTSDKTNTKDNTTGKDEKVNASQLFSLGNQTESTAGNTTNKDGSTKPVLSPSTALRTGSTEGLTTSVVNNNMAQKQDSVSHPTAATEEIKRTDKLNKQADTLVAYSEGLKSKADNETNADTKKLLIEQSEELSQQAQEKKFEAAQVSAKANKAEYSSNQKELDQFTKSFSTNTSDEISMADMLNDEAVIYFDKAQKLHARADTTRSYTDKEILLTEASKNEMMALEKQKKSTDIYKNYKEPVVTAPVVSVTRTEPSTPVNTVSVVNTNIPLKSTKEEHPDHSTTITPTSSDIALASVEVFEQKSTPVYSTKNPIPINEKLPEGLIFKVQIGAFRKSIPQDLFQGMRPITGETTPEGFIRYTAGLFEKYTSAEKVKNKIVGLGYKDAFVVAFLNGKRIPINEAYAMAAGTPATVLQLNNPVANTTQNTVVTNTNQRDIAKAESVSAIQGLFYTVQVGVFSQPVLAANIYSMKPLFTETTSNGYHRYYTGIYKSESRAGEAKEMVVDIGIKDAFVTAYYNGKRISMTEAKALEKQGGGIFSTSANANKLPVFTARQNTNRLPSSTAASEPDMNDKITIVDITNKEEPGATNEAAQELKKIANQNNTMIIDPGTVFKVQIGAFNDEVPVEIANKFLKIANRGINNYKDNTGLTIYTVGNLKTYDEANLLKTEVAAESLTDAFIVAYRNGEKIPVEEARK